MADENKKHEVTDEELRKTLKEMGHDPTDAKFMTEEDEFPFSCKRCGKCCMHRYGSDVIMISPLDIYNASKELGIKPEEFVEQYCDYYIGNTSGMIVVVLKNDKKTDACPLLIKGEDGLYKCKIHKSKPTICALHPLGLMHCGKASETNEGEYEESMRYIMVHPCSESQRDPEMVKVKDWMADVPGTKQDRDIAMELRAPLYLKYGAKYIKQVITFASMVIISQFDEKQREEYGISDRLYDAATIGGVNLLNNMGLKYESMKEFIGDKQFNPDDTKDFVMIVEAMENANMHLTYLDYDVNEPFYPQAKKNYEELKKLFLNSEAVAESIIDELFSECDDAKKEEIRKRFSYNNM